MGKFMKLSLDIKAKENAWKEVASKVRHKPWLKCRTMMILSQPCVCVCVCICMTGIIFN